MGAKRGSVSHFQGKCETETLAPTMNPYPATKELGDGVHEEGRPRRSELARGGGRLGLPTFLI